MRSQLESRLGQVIDAPDRCRSLLIRLVDEQYTEEDIKAVFDKEPIEKVEFVNDLMQYVYIIDNINCCDPITRSAISLSLFLSCSNE